ncbi:MAG: hypothetical protein QXS32_08230 [Candidatus Nezhaarchaeales archaeon]
MEGRSLEGVDNLTDLISAAANLLFGQTNEVIPMVIVRGSQDAHVGNILFKAYRLFSNLL